MAEENTGPAEDRFLPWRKVEEMTGISRTTAWREQKRGLFPAPVVLSPGRVGWRESEVAAWRASRSPRPASQTPPAIETPRTFSAAAPSGAESAEAAAAGPGAAAMTAPTLMGAASTSSFGEAPDAA